MYALLVQRETRIQASAKFSYADLVTVSENYICITGKHCKPLITAPRDTVKEREGNEKKSQLICKTPNGQEPQ